MYQHSTFIRVRYAETDQMGYVYYGNYSTYYEVARVEALRNLGIRYKDLEEAGTMMPVAENYSKFLRPGKYDDLLEVRLYLKEWPTSFIRFDYDVLNEAGKIINQGYTVLAYVDMKTGKRRDCPDNIKAVLKPHFPDAEHEA